MWGATALAFAGVLVVLRPNLLALGRGALGRSAAAFGMAWLMIFNRKAAGDAPTWACNSSSPFAAPLLVAAASSFICPACAIPGGDAERHGRAQMRRGRVRDDLGHILIYTATVRATAAMVAPMTYVQLAGGGGARLAVLRQRPGPLDLPRRGADRRRRPVAVARAGRAARWRRRRTERLPLPKGGEQGDAAALPAASPPPRAPLKSGSSASGRSRRWSWRLGLPR